MPYLPNHIITASLTAYLEELRESGIDGLPKGDSTFAMPEINASPQECSDINRVSPSVRIESDEPIHETVVAVRKSLGDCQRCKLSQNRKNIVFGSGSFHARIMFIGEGPGGDEDASGDPFVGEAGAILNNIITAMGLSREEVYICNVIKCCPPDNRDPELDEIAACSPFLLRQIQSIRPEAIIALGNVASHTLIHSKEPISKLRGKFQYYQGIPLMPTFHPSYILHNHGNKQLRWDVWADVTQVLQLLNMPILKNKNRK